MLIVTVPDYCEHTTIAFTFYRFIEIIDKTRHLYIDEEKLTEMHGNFALEPSQKTV